MESHESTLQQASRPVRLAPHVPRPSLAQMTVGPIVLGVIAGLALGWAAPAYWIVQVLAMVLTVVGVQHPGARAALLPAAAGGVLYGVSILAVRAVTRWPDMADLGPEPMALPVITTVVGVALGCFGGSRLSRH